MKSPKPFSGKIIIFYCYMIYNAVICKPAFTFFQVIDDVSNLMENLKNVNDEVSNPCITDCATVKYYNLS